MEHLEGSCTELAGKIASLSSFMIVGSAPARAPQEAAAAAAVSAPALAGMASPPKLPLGTPSTVSRRAWHLAQDG